MPVLKEGTTLGRTELVGYLGYYENGQFVRAVEVSAIRPKWAQNVTRGGITTPTVGEINKWATRFMTGVEVAGATKTLFDLRNEEDPSKALTGNMKAAVKIGATLAPPGVSHYIKVLDAALDMTSVFIKQYGAIAADSCAKSLIENGNWEYAVVGGKDCPLSPDWFVANCPALAVYMKYVRS